MQPNPETHLHHSESKKNSEVQSITNLIVSVVIMVLATLFITQDMNQIKAFISHAGVWGGVTSIVIYALLGLTLIPSEPLTLFISALFGPLIVLLSPASAIPSPL